MPHETVRLTVAGVAAQQDRVGVLQVAGRHAALRRRLRRDQRQRRRLLRAGSCVRAAAAAAVRQPGEVDVADLEPRAARSGAVARRCRRYNFSYQPENGPLDIQHRSATTGLRTVASNTAPYALLQPDLEHDRERVVRHRLAQHQGRASTTSGACRRSQIEPHGDTSVLIYSTSATGVITLEHGEPAQHAVHAAGESQREPRALRAGQVDAAAADADLRRRATTTSTRRRPSSTARPAASCRRRPSRRARTSRRSRACRAGTTGRSAAARRTTCSAPARRR